MADFDEHLSSLFLADEDPAQGARLGERLAGAAIAQIEREDSRRRLVLISGAAAGIVATLSVVDLSGAISLLSGLTGEMARINPPPAYVWEAAAVLLALYALASFRDSQRV